MLWWRLDVGHVQSWRGCITFLFFTVLEKVRYLIISTEYCWAQPLNFLWLKKEYLCFYSLDKRYSQTCSGYQKWTNLIKIELWYKTRTGVQKGTIINILLRVFIFSITREHSVFALKLHPLTFDQCKPVFKLFCFVSRDQHKGIFRPMLGFLCYSHDTSYVAFLSF